MRLSDKAIAVTGGAQGLGRACSERFIADGARVLITDINEEILQTTAGIMVTVNLIRV
jgi:NAD(P)-dependent dehydrogenase (short-subunit alcohol dehydrogenase family)